jgi:flavin-dependent dehydrogenase
MWGFGIKTALESGHLAAESIIKGNDYGEIARSHFEGRLKATLVNRFLWEVIRFNNYAIVVDERIRSKTKRTFDLSYLYGFGSLHKAVYPVARWFMKRRYPGLRL